MKKLLCLFTALLLLVAAAACSGSSGYKDGVYTAQEEDFDASGWRDQVTITVSGGKITGVEWNSYNEEGQDKKTLSQEGVYDMVSGGAKSQWHEQAASMETALVNEQDPAKLRLRSDGKTDTVSGVSITVDKFVVLAAEALAQA